MTAAEVVNLLGLSPLPEEGGMWARTWRDDHGSGIYYLLRPDDFSALHRLHAPELWHHYMGDPVQMLLLDADGGVQEPVLGCDLVAGHRPCVSVPAGVWMGARTLGNWSLMGATMAPPYCHERFELGKADDLIRRYPSAADRILRHIRP